MVGDAYTALARDGVRCVASRLDKPKVITFDNDEPIPFPAGSSGVAMELTPIGHVAIVRGSDDGVHRVRRTERSIERFDNAYGTNSVGFSPDGVREYWIPEPVPKDAPPSHYKMDGAERLVPKDHTGDYVSPDGWTQIGQDGQPLWTFQATRTLGGVLCTRVIRIDHWEAGMDGTVEINRHLAFDHRDGKLYVVPNSTTQIGPGLCVHPDGTCTVSVSLPAVFVHSKDFEPYTVPAVTVPTFRPAHRKIGVGYFFDNTGDPTIPGSLGVQSPVAFDTRDPNDLDVAGMKTVQQWAKAAKVPYGLYLDRYGFRPNLVPPGGRAMLFCYPQGNIAPSETIAAAVADMYACRDAGVPFDLVVATYCQYSGPGVYALTEQQVLGTLGVLWDHAIDLGAGAIWCFAKTRKHDGVLVDGADYWPSFAEAVRRMRAASDDWRAFPKLSPVDEPAPVPVPIPEDPMPIAPSFHQWIKEEYPRVVAAHKYGHPKPDGSPGDNPTHEWAAFITRRRYSEWIDGQEKWPVETLIKNEADQRPAGTPAPPPGSPTPPFA